MMLCGVTAVDQAWSVDSLSFDLFSCQQGGVAAPEVDVGRGEVGEGLVASSKVVVGGNGSDSGFQIGGQIVVFHQDPVLEHLMSVLDLAFGAGMERPTAAVADASTGGERGTLPLCITETPRKA